MNTVLLSSLEKVFSDSAPCCDNISDISFFKNEGGSFQLAFMSEEDTAVSVALSGDAAPFCRIYSVNSVPSELPCFEDSDDYFLRKDKTMYPDYLTEINGEISARKNEWYSIWIEITPDGKTTGSSPLSVTLTNTENEIAVQSINVNILDALLPAQELVYTNWFHSDCLCDYYGFEALSDEYWSVCESFIQTAVKHGMNCILTPVFTPPLDTAVGGERRTIQLVNVTRNRKNYIFNFKNFRKWVDMCLKCGIEYFEISHLFTQWGAKHAPKIIATDEKGRTKKIFGWETKTSSRKYESFLRQFACALTKELDAMGIREKCFLHVSDEPSLHHLRIYRKRAALISEIFPGFRVIDALSDFDFYKKGVLKNPIPAENHIEAFVGNVPELWVYYCCGQCRDFVPNRFMAMPSVRSRVLGFLLYKYDIKGFLQWGYNFYNTRYSKKCINPFEITDAGKAFPSGDSFVVYPGENKKPLESLRLKVFYDGLRDLSALHLLESRIGREKTIALLEEGLDEPLSFTTYPHSEKWLLDTRERINNAIINN